MTQTGAVADETMVEIHAERINGHKVTIRCSYNSYNGFGTGNGIVRHIPDEGIPSGMKNAKDTSTTQLKNWLFIGPCVFI